MYSSLYIVMYHYIKDFTNPLFKNLKGLDVDLFDWQLDFFSKNFNVLSMEETIDFFSGGGGLKTPVFSWKNLPSALFTAFTTRQYRRSFPAVPATSGADRSASSRCFHAPAGPRGARCRRTAPGNFWRTGGGTNAGTRRPG